MFVVSVLKSLLCQHLSLRHPLTSQCLPRRHAIHTELTVKPRAEVLVPFIPGGGATSADSRTHALAAKVSDRAIKAPSFSGRPSGCYAEALHPIDHRSVRRKPFGEIEKEINAIKRQMEAYRVSGIKCVVLRLAASDSVSCSCELWR